MALHRDAPGIFTGSRMGVFFDTAAIKFTRNPSQTPCKAKRRPLMRMGGAKERKKRKHAWKKVAAIKVIIHLCLHGAGTTAG